jgi:hypothetical protein
VTKPQLITNRKGATRAVKTPLKLVCAPGNRSPHFSPRSPRTPFPVVASFGASEGLSQDPYRTLTHSCRSDPAGCAARRMSFLRALPVTDPAAFTDLDADAMQATQARLYVPSAHAACADGT